MHKVCGDSEGIGGVHSSRLSSRMVDRHGNTPVTEDKEDR